MPLPLLPIAISLASKFAPMLLSKLIGKQASKTAAKVIELAASITGETNSDNLLSVLSSNPTLAKQFTSQAAKMATEIYKEDSARIESVNKTMRAETQAESWWQKAWRPFNGFLFGITLLCDYFLAPIILKIAHAESLDHMPMEIYLLWTTVLGVTAWTRGQEKLTKLKGIFTG
jgi:hypothetical protein